MLYASTGLRLFETRNATIALSILVILYGFTFFVFYPAAITVADEGTYIRQAQLMLAGSPAIEITDPFTGEAAELRPINRYPLGTALLLLPFVALGGPAAACLLSLLCTLAGVGLTGRWIHEQGRSPLFAALVLAYPATMVFGRVAMSEAPSLFLVALGFWLFWRGLSRGALFMAAAGFAAGASFAVREANLLLFAPLVLGSVLRRDAGWPALVFGVVVGVGVRGVSAWLFFGDPLFAKPADAFTLQAIISSAPLYLFCLLVLVPGGLIAAFAYRGDRRPELIASVAIFVVFHLSYSYSGEPSGWMKRLVLGPRYFIPLLPLLAFTAAEVWPRWASGVRARLPAGALWPQRVAGAGAAAGIVLLAVLLVGVQWFHADWSRGQALIRSAIYEATPEGSVIV